MARPVSSAPKRLRISIDVDPDLRKRVRFAAARRELSVREYVLEALEAICWPSTMLCGGRLGYTRKGLLQPSGSPRRMLQSAPGSSVVEEA